MKRTKKQVSDPVSFRPNFTDKRLISELRKRIGTKKFSVLVRQGLEALAKEKGVEL